MRSFVLAAALAVAACSAPPAGNVTQVDVDAAAAAAQGDIDTYAANTASDRPPDPNLPVPVPVPVPPATPSAPASPDDDATAAADVARTYFALVEAGNYARAYRLWADDGVASGLSPRAFADGFARYVSYRAEVGVPGLVEVVDDERDVAVPVRVTGTLADGRRPFALSGALTLHRTVADGASANQRVWRIRDSSLRPRADTNATATAVRYACAGKTRISVRVDEATDTATVRAPGLGPVVLAGQRPAAGIWYRGDGHDLRGTGDNVHYTAPGRPRVACTAAD